MWAFITVIQMAFISLILAQNPSIDPQQRRAFISIITTVQNESLLLSSTPWLIRYQPMVSRDDYTQLGGYKLHTRAVPFNEARMICEENGRHLDIVNSIAEANAITEIFRNVEAITGSSSLDSANIGFRDLYSEEQHVTIHGQSLAKAGFTLWASIQPDNAGAAENCGSFHKSGRPNDINC